MPETLEECVVSGLKHAFGFQSHELSKTEDSSQEPNVPEISPARAGNFTDAIKRTAISKRILGTYLSPVIGVLPGTGRPFAA